LEEKPLFLIIIIYIILRICYLDPEIFPICPLGQHGERNAMPICAICGEEVELVTKCKMCGEKFCSDCGDPDEKLCIYCMDDDDDWDDKEDWDEDEDIDEKDEE
jgi:hypothetical protein